MGKNPTVAMTNSLRELRTSKELTQEQLAEAVGVTRVTINYLENGEYRPSLELAFLLARFFGKPIEDVFHFEGGRREKKRA